MKLGKKNITLKLEQVVEWNPLEDAWYLEHRTQVNSLYSRKLEKFLNGLNLWNIMGLGINDYPQKWEYDWARWVEEGFWREEGLEAEFMWVWRPTNANP